MTTIAQDVKEIMDGWDKIEAEAKKRFPKATKEQLYEICKSAMNRALGIKSK